MTKTRIQGNGPFEVKREVDNIVSDLACCDRNECRCYEAKEVLTKIYIYCQKELKKDPKHLKKFLEQEKYVIESLIGMCGLCNGLGYDLYGGEEDECYACSRMRKRVKEIFE